MSCRICFGGPEDAPELGRLISPCKCTGSSRYVHIVCLQQWRYSGPETPEYFRCGICHYRYQLRGVQLASYLLSTWCKTLVTLLFLNSIAFLLGYVSYPILSTTLTDEDIELVRRAPRAIARYAIGRNTVSESLMLKRGGILEHHLLGTAAMGALGFMKLSWSFFSSGFLRRRSKISLIMVVLGLAYSAAKFYMWSSTLCRYVLRFLANRVVSDVPQDLAKPDEDEDPKKK